MGERLIELREIKKSYGNVFAVGGVNMHVDRGEVVGLLGDNGAGKSTLIKILAGAVRPSSGEILVRGQPVHGWNAAQVARRRHRDGVPGPRARRAADHRAQHLHGPRDHHARSACSTSSKERSEAERLMREIGFTSKVFSPDSIVGQLSGGERQGVAIARAIYNNADLIILDEPTTALSLTETEKVFRFVRTVRESGRSILFIGHNIHHVFDIAERFIVLDRGRVALEIDQGRGPDRRPADRLHGTHRASRPGPIRWPTSAARRSCLMADIADKPANALDRAKPAPALRPRQPRRDRHPRRLRRDDGAVLLSATRGSSPTGASTTRC